MSRQIGSRYQETSRPALEERVHVLEARVAALTDALAVLTRALEGGPLAGPGERNVVGAARQAHDLTLAANAAVPAAGDE